MHSSTICNPAALSSAGKKASTTTCRRSACPRDRVVRSWLPSLCEPVCPVLLLQADAGTCRFRIMGSGEERARGGSHRGKAEGEEEASDAATTHRAQKVGRAGGRRVSGGQIPQRGRAA